MEPSFQILVSTDWQQYRVGVGFLLLQLPVFCLSRRFISLSIDRSIEQLYSNEREGYHPPKQRQRERGAVFGVRRQTKTLP